MIKRPFLALDARANGCDSFEINVRECFDECLRMAERQACEFLRHVCDVAVAAPEDARSFALGNELQFVRMLLLPCERTFRAVNTDVEVVFLAARDLRAMQHAFRTAFVADKHVGVIFKFATGNKTRELRAKRLNLQPRDVASEIFRVRADVAHATARTSAFRVEPPRGLLLALRLDLVE